MDRNIKSPKNEFQWLSVQGLQQKKKMEFSQKSQHQFLKVINALECERTEEIDHIDQSEFDVHQIPSQTF